MIAASVTIGKPRKYQKKTKLMCKQIRKLAASLLFSMRRLQRLSLLEIDKIGRKCLITFYNT